MVRLLTFVSAAFCPLSSAMTLKVRTKGGLLESDNLTAWGSDFPSAEDTAQKRTLLLGIGFPKCGSHHTWEVFSKHEATVTGYEKELKYFAWGDSSEKSLCHALSDEDHEHLSPASKYIKSCYGDLGDGPNKTLLEFSPGYMALRDKLMEKTVRRLQAVSKEMTVRMIALIRDPVERAASEINMFRDYGRVNGTDEDLSNILLGQLKDYSPPGYNILAGEYLDSLKYWTDHFPKESLLVVNTGALNEVTTWRRMFKFAGIEVASDEWIQSTITSAAGNDRKQKATYLKLTEPVKAELQLHYAEYNRQLWDFLGVSPWW